MERLHFRESVKTVLTILAEGGRPCECRKVLKVTSGRITAIIQYLIEHKLLIRKDIGVYEVTEYGKTYL